MRWSPGSAASRPMCRVPRHVGWRVDRPDAPPDGGRRRGPRLIPQCCPDPRGAYKFRDPIACGLRRVAWCACVPARVGWFQASRPAREPPFRNHPCGRLVAASRLPRAAVLAQDSERRCEMREDNALQRARVRAVVRLGLGTSSGVLAAPCGALQRRRPPFPEWDECGAGAVVSHPASSMLRPARRMRKSSVTRSPPRTTRALPCRQAGGGLRALRRTTQCSTRLLLLPPSLSRGRRSEVAAHYLWAPDLPPVCVPRETFPTWLALLGRGR